MRTNLDLVIEWAMTYDVALSVEARNALLAVLAERIPVAAVTAMQARNVIEKDAMRAGATDCKAERDRLKAELAAANKVREELQKALFRWHPGVVGDDSVMDEQAADDAYLLIAMPADETPEYGKQIRDRVEAAERRLHEVREIFTGMDGFIAETAPEGYLQRICRQMYDAAKEGE